MPKLKNHPPKLSKSGNYAYVYLQRRTPPDGAVRLERGRPKLSPVHRGMGLKQPDDHGSPREAGRCRGGGLRLSRLGRNEHRPPGL